MNEMQGIYQKNAARAGQPGDIAAQHPAGGGHRAGIVRSALRLDGARVDAGAAALLAARVIYWCPL